MKLIRTFSRLILGIVFIFSGFVKAVDPLGSAYKFSDYFTAFGMAFLEFMALPLGVLLSAFELVLGITLILGYRRRTIYPVLMWFMTFFTLLTLVLAIFNPVSDCGCFGDALILTNWETFLKNLVLMIFVLVLWIHRKREEDPGPPAGEWIVVGSLFILTCGFSVWNYRHLPLLDFRPYDVGTGIRDEMEIPEGAAVDRYETTLIYRNTGTGETEEFTIENYPKDTIRWEFVSSQSKLVEKGYEPPIHDFAMTDAYGTEVVDRILSDRGYTLVMVAYDLERASRQGLAKAAEWAQMELLAEEFSFYAVTATPTDEVARIVSELQLTYEFLSADEIMLKTIVRSNPGFMLIKNGVIAGKWGFRDFPSTGEVNKQWPEMIAGASRPVEEEMQMLLEAGVYDELSFSVVEFDRQATVWLFGENSSHREFSAVIAFILTVLLLILLSQYVSPIRG